MADLSRRRFFGFLAAPAIVRVASIMPVKALIGPEELFGLAASFRQTEEIVAANLMRDLLLPGLRDIRGNYPQIARAWPSIFKREGTVAATTG